MSVFALWLPILLAAIIVFVASSVIHMMLPVHKSDHRRLPQEEKVLEALRAAGVEPGMYVMPCPGSMKEMSSPEMQEKYRRGPVGFLTLVPSGPPRIGQSLVQWFVYSLVVGLSAGYVATLALQPGAGYGEVFRITGTVAILCYGVANVPDSIWKGASWTSTLKFVGDGVVYGLLTGGVFGWLWPR